MQIISTYFAMENQETESAPKRRLQKKSGIGIVLPVFLLLLFLGGGYFLFFSDAAQKFRPGANPNQQSQTVSPTADPVQQDPVTTIQQTDVQPITAVAPVTQTSNESGTNPVEQAEQVDLEPDTSAAKSETTLTSSPPALSKEQETCGKLADSIDAFFTTLDTRDYMQAFEIGEKSNVYFPKLIQKLINSPPVVSGETDDLFTILQNTAHFFRIIGKKNIFILKGILDRERETFEQTLSSFYQLTEYPDCLKERFDLTITKEPLYYYAGFFLNTMGGRLYLFRRDSMSRMVVSFYAIMIIDQANREGRNKYGIDISDAIDGLIDEIDSSSIKLKMRDFYLDSLYEMKEKYQ